MKKLLRGLGIGAIVLVVSVGGIIGLGVLFVMTASDVPVTDADRQVVARANELAPWFEDFAPQDEYEKFEKVRYIDQSLEVNYEYDSPSEDDPYILVTVSHERSISDAMTTYTASWSGQQMGLNIADSDLDLVERDSFYSVGDQSRFANITYEGEIVGHVLVARKGKSVYAYTITGFSMDDPDLWSELLDDRVNNLASND